MMRNQKAFVVWGLVLVVIVGAVFLVYEKNLIERGDTKIYVSDDLFNFSLDIPLNVEPRETASNGLINISFELPASSPEQKYFNVNILTQDAIMPSLQTKRDCSYFEEQGGALTNQVINGVSFTKEDLTPYHQGVASSASIVGYCVKKDGIVYNIAPTIVSTGHPSDVNKDETLNRILASFKFLRMKLGDTRFYKDSSNVWLMSENGKLSPISSADPRTFELVANDTLVTARDKNHTYGFDAKGYLVIDGKSTWPGSQE